MTSERHLNKPYTNNRQSRLFNGVLIWPICAIFFAYEFLIRTATGTFEQALREDLKLEIIGFALLSTSVYVFVYGLMQIPAGFLIDRYGLKRNLSMASFLSACGVLGFASTHNIAASVFFRAFMAFGASFSFIGLLVVVYEWFPKKNRAFLIGLSQFIGALGPVLAAGPLDSIAYSHRLNWRATFLDLGLLGCLLCLLIVFIVKNRDGSDHQSEPTIRVNVSKGSFLSFLSDWRVWSIALYSGMVYFAIEYLSENSGKLFLTLKGFATVDSSYFITDTWLGFAIGCPFLGFLSDLFNKRRPIMIAASLIALIAMLLIIYLPANLLLTSLAFFLLGIGASGQSISYTMMTEYSSKRFVAAALGFNNAMISVFAGANAPLIGALVKLYAGTQEPVLSDYQNSFLLIVVLMFFAILLASFFIPETYTEDS
jgi:MFS family permease